MAVGTAPCQGSHEFARRSGRPSEAVGRRCLRWSRSERPERTSPMAAITYDRATVQYPGAERPSVNSLDLQIADGEFLVLVGPSGCGKSTSLRALAGLEEVTEGSIRIGDRD